MVSPTLPTRLTFTLSFLDLVNLPCFLNTSIRFFLSLLIQSRWSTLSLTVLSANLSSTSKPGGVIDDAVVGDMLAILSGGRGGVMLAERVMAIWSYKVDEKVRDQGCGG